LAAAIDNNGMKPMNAAQVRAANEDFMLVSNK
jgi:hypothetical protein